jgi:hypothetical protein
LGTTRSNQQNRITESFKVSNASVAKGKAWNILEEKSKLLLDLARLEFSKEPNDEDYATRIQFEGLDEKFAPATKTTAEPVAVDATAPGTKQ